VFIISTISFVIVQLVATVIVSHSDVVPINATNHKFVENDVLTGHDHTASESNNNRKEEPDIKDDGIFHAEPPEYHDNHEEVEVYNSEHNEVNLNNCTSDHCNEEGGPKDDDSALSYRTSKSLCMQLCRIII